MKYIHDSGFALMPAAGVESADVAIGGEVLELAAVQCREEGPPAPKRRFFQAGQRAVGGTGMEDRTVMSDWQELSAQDGGFLGGKLRSKCGHQQRKFNETTAVNLNASSAAMGTMSNARLLLLM